MQKWFRTLINHMRKGRADHSPSSLGASGFSQKESQSAAMATSHSQPTPPRLLVWTKEEAELAWKAKRTEVNLALMLSEKAMETVQSCSGSFMVDGNPARVVVCVNDAVKQWLLNEATKQRVLSKKEDTIRKEQPTKEEERTREERQKAIEEEWKKNGCVKDSSGQWKFPHELIWRSLPRGEDR